MVNITINGADDRVAPTDIRLIIDSPLIDQNNMNFNISATLVATDADPGNSLTRLVSQSPRAVGGDVLDQRRQPV